MLTLPSQKGYYTPTPVANLTSTPSKNITFCSNQTSFFSFDPAATIQNELKSGVKLTDLNWPDELQKGVYAMKGLTKVLFFFYFVAAISTGTTLVAALVGVRAVWRYSAIMALSAVCHPEALSKTSLSLG